MDLLDVIQPLPGTNPAKRLIAFCMDDLKLTAYEARLALRRALAVADAVATLSAEANYEATTRQTEEMIDRMRGDSAALLRKVTALTGRR